MQILFIILNFFVKESICAQTTDYPNVEKSNNSNCKIISVNIENDKTKVAIEYEKTERTQNWVYISKNTILCDFYNVRNYFLIQGLADNQLDTKYSTTGKIGQKYYFTLIFPKLPSGIEKINVAELIPGGNGFEWSGISINNPDNSTRTDWTENTLKDYWKLNGSDVIEGIYESTDIPKYITAIKKNNNDGYDLIYLSGAENMGFNTWKEGDVKATFTKTAKLNFYDAQWLMFNKTIDKNVYTTFDQAMMIVNWPDKKMEQTWIKDYPINSIPSSRSDVVSSGTGFALTSNGLIVTNHHVIEGANSIIIKGVNGNFSNSFNAKVVADDRKNDLAILQIEDNNFNSINKIPYVINSSTSDVGENVFVLGYPLRSAMGDDIKLTNGIISSKSGFQGDITSYQISVPIQPGNSGGPLFDNAGNLIGVINSKLSGGENVSYAIKISYLKNLIDVLPSKPFLNTINTIFKLTLSNQVKVLNKYVYIIEAR